jgi:predicted GNAT family acetyltransferase
MFGHMADAPQVVNNEVEQRFEIHDGGHVAALAYSKTPGRIACLHTDVPSELEGRGYGGRLAKEALEYATREHLYVVPLCPFVRGYLSRHPEYQALLES